MNFVLYKLLSNWIKRLVINHGIHAEINVNLFSLLTHLMQNKNSTSIKKML